MEASGRAAGRVPFQPSKAGGPEIRSSFRPEAGKAKTKEWQVNKNGRQRRSVALRNYRVNQQAYTTFDVAKNQQVVTQTVFIGHIKTVKKPQAIPRYREAAPVMTGRIEAEQLVAAADKLLGKPKFDLPREPRPHREPRPLARIPI